MHGSEPFRAVARSGRAGFNFTSHMQRICADIAARVPQLAHIDLQRMLVTFAQTRTRNSHGLYASVTPLRFAGGAATCRRRGRTYGLQRVLLASGGEALYILTFYLPRFMDLGFQEKLVTVFHELWHISPEFNGDLRRHPGRCYAHTQSQKEYDAQMAELVRQWLVAGPPPDLYRFLQGSFADLRAACGAVIGTRVRRPKLVPLD